MFVWEAVRPLCYGHVALVIPDDVILDTTRLASFLGEHGTTRLLSTPSLLATLLDTEEEASVASKAASAAAAAPAAPASPTLQHSLSSVRVWLLCGEVVPATLAERANAALPSVSFVNDYSSWEGSDVSLAMLSTGRLPAAGQRCAPAGKLLPGVRCAILSPNTGEVVPRGCVGEVYVSSPMLFTAYLGAPALTADRLRPMPERIPS